MTLYEYVFSALSQVAVVFGLACLIYGAHWLFFRRHLAGQSFYKYLGLNSTRTQINKGFWAIWLGLTMFAILSLIIEFRFSETFRQMFMSDSSPYGKILKTGFDSTAILKVFRKLISLSKYQM